MVWFLLLWPPVAFALVLAVASVQAVRRGAHSAEAVGDAVQTQVPILLAVTLALVGFTLLGLASGDGGAVFGQPFGSWRGVGVGTVVGIALAAAYFGGLERAVNWAQTNIGDYVPAGSTAVLGTHRVAFFAANVVLAPLVEELWYRGVLFDALAPSFSPVVAALVGCAAFGLFHWPGGAWYVVVTGALVGGSCWALRVWDGGIAAPYAAHLSLNVVEYVVAVRASRQR